MELVIHIFMVFVACYSIAMYSLGTLFRGILKPLVAIEKDYTYQPLVSVLMPTFNEGKHAYDTIRSMRNVNYPIDKLEILAYDDCSKDDTFEWIKKAEKEFRNVKVVKNLKNQGKAATMIDAAIASNGEILIGIDSDCVFDKNVVLELVSCFPKNPKLAAVGGRVGVLNTNETWLTQIQAVFYLASFMFVKIVENSTRKVQCLSGPLVAIRRSIFFDLIPQIKNRTFLGVKITNGEDRALTQMLLREGYDTYVNLDSVCWTSVPTKLKQYILQQLRWRRSAIGQWLEAIYNLPLLIKNSTFSSVIFSLAPIYVLLSWVILVMMSTFSGHLFQVLVTILVFHFILSPVIVLTYLNITNNSTYEKINNKLKFIYTFFISIFWFPISGLIITIVALSTLDDGGWVTRT